MVLQSVDKGQLVASQQDQSMQQISSQFSDALRLNSFEPNGEIKVCPKFQHWLHV